MTRWLIAVPCALLVLGAATLGCEEEMVGAPCVPETDRGSYNDELQGRTYSIETRSVQCETRICLTQTSVEPQGQLKFSFCSCRCKDLDGNTYLDDPDKFDYLCECPPDTLCEPVLGDIKEAPEKITGSYCVPKCIASPCEVGEICTPSTNSEEPWKWTCEAVDE